MRSSLALACLALSACSEEAGPGPGTDPPASCNTDYSQLASTPPVSLKNDLMPMFGLSCAGATSCHNTRDKKAGLYLGVKCGFDIPTKTCVFATEPNPDTTKPQVLTDAIVAEVHASLIADSMTVPPGDGGPGVKRVVPGDPGASFLIDKLLDKQNARGYTNCDNQDTRVQDPCGEAMPVGGALCTTSGGPEKFTKIAAWIAQGAQNN